MSIRVHKKAKIAMQNTPSLFEAIVQSTAKISQCKIVTGDEHFKNLPETIWIE
jgi:hypothetical protein